MADFSFSPGWRGIDDNQRALAAGLPTLSQAAPHLIAEAADSTEPILLYRAWKAVLGDYPAYPSQCRGDCVSFGHGHGNDLLQCVEIGLGEPFVYQPTDPTFLYGESRKLAGILRSGDGSYGAAAIQAMTTVGMVSVAMLGPKGEYTGARVDDWGHHGPPADVEAKAAAYKLGGAAQVSSWDELVAALKNGYPVTECSNFLPGQTRDADGFVKPSGHGGHCQVIVGVRFDRPGVCIANSWGADYYNGPCELDCPPFAYWIDRDVFESWIAGSGDNWALSKTPGFEKRDVPPAWKYSDVA